jgi:hypothetical protein
VTSDSVGKAQSRYSVLVTAPLDHADANKTKIVLANEMSIAGKTEAVA